MYASGEASILDLISAGIYAEGTFLDADLAFRIGSSHGKSFISLDGDFRAFTLSIGAVYDKFHCSLEKGWSRRRLEGNLVDGKGTRRALWPHWGFLHKIAHEVNRFAGFVSRTVKRVKKVIRNIATKGLFNTFCDKSKGYK